MAAPTSPPSSSSREPSHPELVEPASLPKLAEELREAEQRFQGACDELEEMEGLLPSVNPPPHRQVLIEEWMKEAEQFQADYGELEMKIHRFPASLQGLDQRYILPKVVGIGLYHHNSGSLQEMEKVKRVAAHHFVSKCEPDHTFDEMYAAVFSVVGGARRFYDASVDEIGDAEFADMMFIDGCFLLQFMFAYTTSLYKLPQSLLSCFKSNRNCICNDIMLLENQLPWLVVDTLRRFRYVPVEEFIRRMGHKLQIRGDMDMGSSSVLDGSSYTYTPPHLLGNLWFQKTGSINGSSIPLSNPGLSTSMSKSIGAIELGEIGIKLTASKTTKFADMGVKRGCLSSELFLAPLLLDDVTSCWLVNMAALEISVGMATWSRTDTYQIHLVVCSYLAVLAMLMDREGAVHELRSKGLVQGQLTNKETLDFFKMFVKRISPGILYVRIMKEVEAYKLNRWMWIEVYRSVNKYVKPVVKVLSIIGVLLGIFKVLPSFKKQ